MKFRKLIISMCQKEFDKVCSKDLGLNCDCDQSCEEVDLENRSCAIMQFIGKFYLQNMLTARIMHECVTKLLYAADEGSLECLCKLLFVIAKKLVPETLSKLEQGPEFGINDISVYL